MHLSDHVADLAKSRAGNHAKFQSFGWSSAERPDDAENWAIVYTSNRDSNALQRSNHRVYARTLAKFDETSVIPCSHSHWACGHVDGFVIRVYQPNGDITPAFEAYATLAIAAEDYPILDDDVFSELEEEEACATWAAMSLKERIEVCKRYKVSILAARHDYYPQDDNGSIFEYLRAS